MPIPVRCPQCSKGLKVPDKYAGKAIKCPGCQKGIKVPAGGASAARPKAAPKKRRPAAVAAAPESDSDFLADLDLGSGGNDTSVQICPKCATEIPDEEVVCDNCGHNIETGSLDAAVAKQRARKGADPNDFYSKALPDAWKFLKTNFNLATKTTVVWSLFGTLACIFSVILANCSRGPTIFFWTCLTGLATFAVAGWYWFLSDAITRLTLDREDKMKRLNVDTFQTLALGIKAVVWPFVMGLPVWIIVFAGLYFSGETIFEPATFDAEVTAFDADGVPIEMKRNGEKLEEEEVAGLVLQSESIIGKLRRLGQTPGIVILATYLLMYTLYPIAQIHLISKYTYKASVLWELIKVVPANIGPVIVWNLIVLLLAGPIIAIFAVLELYGGGANIFTNEHVVTIGEKVGGWIYELVQGSLDEKSLVYKLFRELVCAALCFLGISIIAFLASVPAVMLMRVTGKFGIYNLRKLGIMEKTHHGDPAGFWVRYVAFAIDCFCIPFAVLIAGREKALSTLGGLFTAIFVMSAAGYPAFMPPIGVVFPFWIVFSAWMYYTVLESGTARASIGKENMKLVTETLKGKQLKLGGASTHFLMSFITFPLFFITGFDPEKKSPGDRMSKSRVVWKGDN